MKRDFAIYFFGFLSLIGVCFILVPSLLKPVYVVWLKVANFIGRTITTLVLSLAYYLVITPSAVMKRLFGGKPLPVEPDKSVSTYWVTRSEPAQPKERFFKRY